VTVEPAPSSKEEIKSLAFAISECDRVLIIDENNKGHFGTSLEEALYLGKAFAIKPHASVLALDFDDPDDLLPLFKEVVDYLKSSGLKPVIASSGTKGHMHLFCRVQDSNVQIKISDFISAKGVSRWMRSNTFIRPPLAPHREGKEVFLLEPSCPSAAAAMLAKDQSSSVLPESTIEKIKYGINRFPKYLSGSELTQAIVNSCYSSGIKFHEIYSILIDPRNMGGDSLRKREFEKGKTVAQNWLRSSYEKAARFIKSKDLSGLPSQVEICCRIIQDSDINSRRKLSMIKLIKSHADIASRCRSYTYNASLRQLAEASKISSLMTIRKANEALIEQKLLFRLNNGRNEKATRWRIFPLERIVSNTSLSLRPSKTNRGCGFDVLSAIHFDHESFRYSFLGKRGLGTSAAIILDCLYRNRGLRIAQICSLTGFSRSTVARALRRLSSAGVAIQEGKSWHTPPINLDEQLNRHAGRLGLDRAAELQKERHSIEREGYRSLYSVR